MTELPSKLSSLRERVSNLITSWKRVISVSNKPDKNELKLNIRITFLVLGVVGVISYLVQLVFTLLGVIG